jgi:predicted phage-related endonuclease
MTKAENRNITNLSGRTVLAGLTNRRSFIGGSDARTIMGDDEAALLRLWREKRGEVEPEDLSGNLIVQLGLVTEPLNRIWYERNTGQVLTDVQRRMRHPVIRYMAATLDGMVEATGAVFEAKFMLPWSFSEEGAAQKYMPQLQHNMWVTNAKLSVLSIITGGGANGSRLRSPLIVSISTCFSPQKRSSGAASKAASPLASSVSSRRDHGSRPSGS